MRYVFYDIQVESVDFSHHYSEASNLISPALLLDPVAGSVNAEGAMLPSMFNITPLILLALDVTLLVVQVFLGAIKLIIAGFLLWLIMDLFLLRPLHACETIRQRRQARRHMRTGALICLLPTPTPLSQPAGDVGWLLKPSPT